MKRVFDSVQAEIRLARRKWGEVGNERLAELRKLLRLYRLSVSLGDVFQIEARWYVTHAGLLRLAERRRCAGIHVGQVLRFCDPTLARWVFKATVYKTPDSRGFVGYGDADPSNVSSLVHGAEMRVAETRAVNRALRKAYGIGLCSVEELSCLSSPAASPGRKGIADLPSNGKGPHNGQPRLRDQLCLLIRQHNLDPNLVKAYAADFCGTQTIEDASRDLVESFIAHLAASAREDRDGLVCKLNSFAQPVEVRQ